jgi:hypothetical protein
MKSYDIMDLLLVVTMHLWPYPITERGIVILGSADTLNINI